MTANTKQFSNLKQLPALLRLSHWPKAGFVLLGVFYSGSMELLPEACFAALAFSLIASAVYIYNDLQDQELDRLHPNKCRRPLAREEISIDFALGLSALLLLGGLVVGYEVSSRLAAILGLYLLLNLAYNHGLKSLPLMHVVCIASGFMLRVLAGTIGIGLEPSKWLILMSCLISLLIALCKRRLERQLQLKYSTKTAHKKQSPDEMDWTIYLVVFWCFAVYLVYVLWEREAAFYFFLTLPFAAIGLWRFAWLSTRDSKTDDPLSIFFRDGLSRLNALCFLVISGLALYG